jgi:hypothetical protein
MTDRANRNETLRLINLDPKFKLDSMGLNDNISEIKGALKNSSAGKSRNFYMNEDKGRLAEA